MDQAKGHLPSRTLPGPVVDGGEGEGPVVAARNWAAYGRFESWIGGSTTSPSLQQMSSRIPGSVPRSNAGRRRHLVLDVPVLGAECDGDSGGSGGQNVDRSLSRPKESGKVSRA